MPVRNFDDPYYKRVWKIIKIIFEATFEAFIPALLGIFLVGLVLFIIVVIIMVIASALGISKSPAEDSKKADSDEVKAKENQTVPGQSAQAVDEQTRLQIEIQFLEETLKIRREVLEKLVNSKAVESK
ncbi:hypothetical protein ASPWEDRAFT_41436 [Aspergillus wentii DTO 134E9]|uniref:Uncharacterized protein n=1 Tax=Aspergillus wentii DTO 134E9 TaxID=1073089 RepID=A0A1L9RMR7_ASPWE|nr:uncharacterized protein ASPWEDRAFT_41436 [Aspergillus wentii DTO 134E9]KAI9929336.1 hypothetical protein MW887_000804 [Aspergillus wentii]OJJ36226.1 hypothetical protein ASPWEDRAFT_41436 [Aspergillus wentii DTO 134E9]